MPNLLRGEVEVIIDHKPYILRPTFDALHKIEQQLSNGLLAIARKLADGALTLEELVTIITCCNCGGITSEQIKATLLSDGVVDAMEKVAEMLGYVFRGHEIPK